MYVCGLGADGDGFKDFSEGVVCIGNDGEGLGTHVCSLGAEVDGLKDLNKGVGCARNGSTLREGDVWGFDLDGLGIDEGFGSLE
ncbi:hypothetical protein M5689_001790 [Euphorbia peplus]|nr:hypothetical protein M5689_001790 [Euphorbia peplus]